MLANRMTDDSSETKDIPANQSSEPHVVVCCPSCKTKFAVEGSLIAAYEVPKFHCSRCDLVFQIAPAKREEHLASAPQENPRRWVLADGSDHKASNPFSQPRPQASALKPTDFTLGEAATQSASEPSQAFAPLEERAGLSLLGLRPSAGPALSSAFTRQEALTKPAQTSSNTNTPLDATDEEQTELDPFSLFDTPGAQQKTVTETAPPVEQPIIQVEHTAPLPSAVLRKQDLQDGSKPAQRQDAVPTANAPVAQRVPVSRRASRALHMAISKLSVRNQGLAYLSLPVIALLAFFCVVSYASTLMPRTMGTVLHSTVPSILTGKVAQLPPANLLVQEVSIEFEKTQSKELIPVVRGVIYNSGTSAIEDILVEALGFDVQGDVVIRSQAPLRSALTREKISDLPLATVKKFQTSLSGRNSTIDAGERVAFSVALLSDAVVTPQVAYFSARIFSVGARR
jgi:hypothetical protein